MVIGLDKFREALGAFHDSFVIIGGTACDAVLSETSIRPRATDDIDMVLIVENMTPAFGAAFWNFFREGGYKPEKRQRLSDAEPRYELYRFVEPKHDYPVKIELLSKQTHLLNAPADIRIEPFHTGENVSSLSAIIMDDLYYDIAVSLSEIRNELRYASIPALIILKIKAYQNLVKERATGKQINTKDIKKHRNDVFKLLAARNPNKAIPVKKDILDSIVNFADEMRSDLPNPSLEAAMEVDTEAIERLIDDLLEYFISLP